MRRYKEKTNKNFRTEKFLKTLIKKLRWIQNVKDKEKIQ